MTNRLSLSHDLISQCWINKLIQLLPGFTRELKQASIKKGAQVQQELDSLHQAKLDTKGIKVSYNQAFGKSLVCDQFPQDKIIFSASFTAFQTWLISEVLKEWVIELNDIQAPEKTQSRQYLISFGDQCIGLSINEQVEKRILSDWVGINVNTKMCPMMLSDLVSTNKTNVDITLPSVSLPMKDILNLGVGRIIKTNRRIDQGVTLKIDGKSLINNAFVSNGNNQVDIIVGNING